MILADEVIELLRSAQRNALIVAPFIRSEALTKLLDAIPPEVETTVVTRWRPLDLLAGASDLQVFDVAVRKSAQLLLRNDLHAKLFAADNDCLVGSANVTNLALGWRQPANLELLISVPRTQSGIPEFERTLLAGCVLATDGQREALKAVVEDLKSRAQQNASLADRLGEPPSILPWNWVPRTRTPEDLYAVYSGETEFGRELLDAMQADLRAISPPASLDLAQFNNWLATMISQTPLIAWIVSEIDHTGSVNETNLEKKLSEMHIDTDKHRARDILETVRRWMTHFLPTRYETTADSLKLIRAKTL
ncbi:MAG: phospholipase D family protein [Gammaproteobacteria bacterium]|nr:phospholipase D family protein [Gammaproteobacteria bacterium]